MKFSSVLAFAVSAAAVAVPNQEWNTWNTWSATTPVAECTPTTVYETAYQTQWQNVYSTTTVYKTEYQTEYQTAYSTEYKTETDYQTKTVPAYTTVTQECQKYTTTGWQQWNTWSNQ